VKEIQTYYLHLEQEEYPNIFFFAIGKKKWRSNMRASEPTQKGLFTFIIFHVHKTVKENFLVGPVQTQMCPLLFGG
jgi:hypothetical protein